MIAVVDLTAWRDTAERAVRAGGAVLAATDRTSIDIRLKDERVDLTTSADAASQEAAVAVIRAAFPEHTVVGEEGTVPGPDDRHVWYVDGLDGTSNFAHGLPWYCVSVGLRVDGSAVAGAVHDPVHDELFSAARGLGSTCNGRPLRVDGPHELARAVVATQVQTSDPDQIRRFVREMEAFMLHCGGVRFMGAPALLLSHIAAGHLTAYVEREMPPWDITAGQLILTEAGGRITDLDGTDVDTDRVVDVVATSGGVHDALLAVFPR